ncbi:MAG: ABC transporter permease [Solirubrobacterales bacterium]|nr:ABC transporter permease [Solirubrobacterales bacterium]
MSWLEPLSAQVEIRDRSGGDCVTDNGAFCFDWLSDNWDRYVDPTIEHLILVAVSVIAGFLIAFGLAYLSHRKRWLQPGFTSATGILYTIPSIAFFALLLPITGRGTLTGLIALTAFALQILYRNINTGLNNVPDDVKEAGIGMGMSPNQLFWKIELPLSVPEIIAGLRIATVSTVAIATLAVFAGAGGLGGEFTTQIDFKTNVIFASLICVTMAIVFDVGLLIVQAFLSPWRSAAVEGKTKSRRAFGMFRRTAT